ncbi:probable WRKY transcription factor 4 isoform X2 [Salvia splendens]|uniref:probable WRKY transcription factor 4 isoform X2 n=1 Tax=Salvia splendens TaxID=180675 RepID=UPI001C2708F1|nr:probable WRKY transcription factor 4 isoform X2 [Salvia splendens]
MGETSVADAAGAVAAARPKPATIAVPPRGSVSESLFTNGLSGMGFSPGPMSLVSSFFSDQGPFSFSQLLAGATASPIAAPQPKEETCRDSSENDGAGFKRNRPMTLVVAPPQQQPESLSPLFMVPPGLTPSGILNSPAFLSPLQVTFQERALEKSPFGMSHQQALAHVTAQAAFSQSHMQMNLELQRSSVAPTTEAPVSHSSPAPSETLTEQVNLPQRESSKLEPSEVSQSDKKAAYVTTGDKPASDGYNWRKYGQKCVKASECPRSYYKCTYANCLVKKKVERSYDGRVSEIVYKGEHNHDPPQSNKRKKDSSVALDGETNCVDENVHESQNDEMEGSLIVIDDEKDNEPLAKRRQQSMPATSHQTITESKIVVQTRSEVDLLDDGYKWRKYGQKVVKGNPHPRSYYRCTYAGCNVRKQVERSSADPKAVITSYEGKHSHEIPAGKYMSSNQGLPAANAQLSKMQRVMAKAPSEMEFGSEAPITLHLKEEEVAV